MVRAAEYVYSVHTDHSKYTDHKNCCQTPEDTHHLRGKWVDPLPHPHVPHTYIRTYVPAPSSAAGVNRPRSKTFEEYEKETDDIWNDGDEDLDALTHSTELDMVPEGVVGGAGRTTAALDLSGVPKTRNTAKGKGKGKNWIWERDMFLNSGLILVY